MAPFIPQSAKAADHKLGMRITRRYFVEKRGPRRRIFENRPALSMTTDAPLTRAATAS